MLGILFPKLEGQLMLAKNVQLIEALQEIKIHEEDTSFLSPQCQLILGKSSSLIFCIVVCIRPRVDFKFDLLMLQVITELDRVTVGL